MKLAVWQGYVNARLKHSSLHLGLPAKPILRSPAPNRQLNKIDRHAQVYCSQLGVRLTDAIVVFRITPASLAFAKGDFKRRYGLS